MAKKSPAKFKTWGNVFDNFTITTIQKIMDKRVIDGLFSPLKIGKESNVFIGRKEGKNIIVKIYRLEVCDFHKMYDYIKYDPRFARIAKRKRQIIFSWAQREFRNLHLARDAGLRVPSPYFVSNNVLIEEFIGDKKMDMHGEALPLKDAYPKDPTDFYKQTKKMVKKLLKANLVHADLSAFNILNHKEKPVFIDFSQATPLENPRAREYYLKDSKNLIRFFSKLGVDCSLDEFKKIWNDHIKKR